jgi:hypothetical protein
MEGWDAPGPLFAILKSRRICVKIKANQTAEEKVGGRFDSNRADRPAAPGGFAEAQRLSSAGR